MASPTKTDDSIGRVKIDKPRAFPARPDLRWDIPAAEWERIKDAIIANAAGLASSVHLDTIAPTTADNEAAGYAAGTLWIIPPTTSPNGAWVAIGEDAGDMTWLPVLTMTDLEAAAYFPAAFAAATAQEMELTLYLLNSQLFQENGVDLATKYRGRRVYSISGIQAWNAANDNGDVMRQGVTVYATGAGAMAWTLGDCSTRLPASGEVRLEVQCTGAATAVTITPEGGSGVTINGSGAAWAAPVGRTRFMLRSLDGINFFTG